MLYRSQNHLKWRLNGMMPSCKLLEIEDNFKYRISDALMGIYKLVWDDFCSWFLEMIKPAYQQPIDSVTFESNRNAVT
jgi:valyl-tRNA synthetase